MRVQIAVAIYPAVNEDTAAMLPGGAGERRIRFVIILDYTKHLAFPLRLAILP
jgi:hypothetical protein